MSKDIATLTGADLDAFKAALSGYGYLTPIFSVTITTPVEYVDIALPSTFSIFNLSVVNLVLSVDDAPYAALSPDNGATFYNDTLGFTSYVSALYGDEVFDGGASSTVDARSDPGDSLFSFGAYTNGVGPFHIRALIYPGETGAFASVLSQCSIRQPTPAALACTNGSSFLTTSGRQNLMRVQPWGNGDCNPPTSGETMTAGTFLLSGVK
jgi:hypothetical protein